MLSKNIPELRFLGYDNKWERLKLGEVCDVFQSGKNIKSHDILDEGMYPVFGGNGLRGYTSTYNYEGLYAFIGRQGALCGNVNIFQGKSFFTEHAIVVKASKENDTKFLFYLLEKMNLRQYSDQSAQPGLAVNKLIKLFAFIPIYEEQVKIGMFFERLDETISLQQQELTILKQTKQGFLQKMFPKEGEAVPEVRFPGYSRAWEQKKIGDLANIVRGASPRPIQNPKWFDKESGIGWLRISDVTEQNGRIHYLEQHISKAGQEKTRVLTEPHLLLSIAATVGKPVVNYIKTGVHDGFLVFLNPKFEREFMFQWLEMFRPKWQKYGQPGSQVNLNSELVRNQEIFLPSIEEQKEIGEFFIKLDNIITISKQELEVLQQTKKAFLQKMFV